MKRMKYIGLILLFIVSAINIHAAALHLNFDHYQISNGLPSNKVLDLTFDDRGFLWIATDGGLSRFDGAVFRDFNVRQYPSLFNNTAIQVCPAENGDILASGYRGFLQRYDSDADSFITIVPKKFAETIGFLDRDTQTRCFYLHIITGSYTFQLNGEFSSCQPLNKICKYIKNSFIDNKGHLWALNDSALYVFNNKTLQLICKTQLPHVCNTFTPRILQLKNGNICVYSSLNSIDFYQLKDKKLQLLRQVHIPFDGLREIQVATDGSMWFASDGEGLWMSNGIPNSEADFNRIKPYGVSDYDFCKIYSILADSLGNIWVGTQNSGLWHYSIKSGNGSFSSHDLGLPNCVATCFCELPNGHILSTCEGLGICEFSKEADYCKIYTEADGLSNKNVTSVFLDTDNHLLVGTWGNGFYESVIDGGKIHFTQSDKTLNNHAKISFCRKIGNNDFWSCMGGDGLFHHQDNQWTEFPLMIGKWKEVWPNMVTQGKDNDIWISTSTSMWRVQNGKLFLYNLSQFDGTDAYIVSDMQYVRDYGLVAATNKGLLKADTLHKTFVPIDIVPQNEYVASLTIDTHNNLIATIGNCIWRIDLLHNKAEKFYRNFDNNGAYYFQSHAAFCSSDGKIYLGTSDGFICITEKDFNQRASIPSLYFSHVIANGQNQNLSTCNSHIVLPYGHTALSVSIDMADFSKERTHLYYRLNKNEEWQLLNRDQMLSFYYLPTGNYTLQVKTEGMSPENYLQLYIEVEAPWWRTGWFWSLCAFIILLLIGLKLYEVNRDRKLLKQMVNERTSELNEALSTKNRIMRVVAHDLRNPVFAIYGALKQLQTKLGYIDKNELSETINQLTESTQSVQTELGKLLEWATAKQTEQTCQPANINLDELVSSEINLLKLQADKKQIKLCYDCNVKQYVYADSRMLSTSVRNVIGNSLKFTPSGKNIYIHITQASSFATIEIKDEGVGMTAEQLSQLLNAEINKSQTGTAGEAGTGLGIGLAKKYMQNNGGTFQMTSQPGMGTTTILQIPLSQQQLTAETTSAESKAVTVNINEELLQGNTILVVDDDALIAKNIKSMLDEYVDVLVASNGKEALNLINNNNVDIVVTDVDMPEMNGIELGNAILGNPQTNYIPLLYLSARTSEDDRLKGLQTGAVDYISKPFSREELLIKLNNILSLRQRMQQKLLAEWEKNPHKQNSDTAQTADNEQINPYLQKVMDMIALHHTDLNYSIEQLASDLCTSHITLYRKVKSLSGLTPLDLLNDFRLRQAHQLLEEGKDLQDVAMQVGFQDYTYFARKFKTKFGYPPKDVVAKHS